MGDGDGDAMTLRGADEMAPRSCANAWLDAQAWNVPMLMAAIAFYMRSYEGYAFMMFGMGWSVAMFYQQNVLFRFDKSPLWWLPYV